MSTPPPAQKTTNPDEHKPVEAYHPPDVPVTNLPTHAPLLDNHLSKMMSDVKPVSFEYKNIKGEVTAVDLVQVISAIADSCAHIAKGMRFHMVQRKKATNEFGDEILSVDELAEGYIQKRLSQVPAVKSISSEEHPTLKILREEEGLCCVTYDPLDGSSVIGTNFSVGSIFAIWPGVTPVGLQVNDILASVICVYGPRTTIFVSHRSFGTFEYMLFDDNNNWGLVHKEAFKIAPKAKIFAPGNLRAAKISQTYASFIQKMIQDGVTLRYTGAMVPDTTQILVKKSGIFVTPVQKPFTVKLRMCFEVAPIGFMILCSGGEAYIAETQEKLLDVKITALDQRSSIIVGSKDTVNLLVDALKNNKSKL
jgi:sedoheptulose-bisphosphatase